MPLKYKELACVAALLPIALLRAQTPVFEVATVKLNQDGPRSRYPFLHNGTLTAGENVPEAASGRRMGPARHQHRRPELAR